MLHAVVMAGGSGTRFWPASRAALPKQLLELAGGRTMIQATVDRLRGLVPSTRILVVTNQQLTVAVQQQLPELRAEAIIGEPCKRDTAPCIGLAALLVARSDPDGVLLVLPADHVIRTDEQFQAAVNYAAKLIRQCPETIVTFGIRPTYPADSFGYIERGNRVVPEQASVEKLATAPADLPATFRTRKFREKPSVEVAKQYLSSGDFYWNSGIFLWTARTILAALQQYEPRMYEQLTTIAAAAGQAEFSVVLEREFSAIEGKSIDYAVMEHYPSILVVEAPFEWDDVGNWHSLSRLRGTDQDGNTIFGKHLGIRTTNSIVRGQGDHLVVTVGLNDVIVIQTPDATLVANKHDEESLRQIVQILKERGWTSYI